MQKQKDSKATTPVAQEITTPEAFHNAQGTKYLWKWKSVDDALVRSISYKHNISIPIAHVLAARGFCQEEQVRSFLFSSYERDVPDPRLLKGMDIAVARILKAIKNQEKILIFGDYDVDGVTSASMALCTLLPLGAKINFFLPNRVKDGYGLSSKAVKLAHKNGYGLIITVDNGITAFEAADTARELGIDLIITDHHRAHGHVPHAMAIINPNQHDCPYPFKSLAGVGVTFKIMSMIYQELGIPQLPEKTYELLLLGTVADVVPLLGENRFWVQHGLNKINHYRSNAIRMLAQNSNLTKETFDSLDIGFMIAPQINALGRLADARDAVKFMISADMGDVEKVGKVLKEINDERKRVDQAIFSEIEKLISSKQIDLSQDLAIVASSNSWPAGVIGLVAGKLMHNHGRPTLLFHLDKQGFAKGSCRSIPEFNIFDALTENSDLLVQFGGHSFAAGLKLKKENLPLLKQRINDSIAKQLSLQELQPKLSIDAPLQLPDLDSKFMADFEQLEPFGNQNSQPLFLIKDATLLKKPQIMKEKHLKCMIFSQGVIKPVVFFNRPDLIELFDQIGEKSFDLAAHVMKNEWGGTVRIELQGIDLAVHE